VATGIGIHDGSVGDEAFKVERRALITSPKRALGDSAQHRRAVGRHLDKRRVLHLRRALEGFGFSFYTALAVIIIGNVSYFLLGSRRCRVRDRYDGVHDLSSALRHSRSRLLSFFNWLTQLGFETEDSSLSWAPGWCSPRWPASTPLVV